MSTKRFSCRNSWIEIREMITDATFIKSYCVRHAVKSFKMLSVSRCRVSPAPQLWWILGATIGFSYQGLGEYSQ